VIICYIITSSHQIYIALIQFFLSQTNNKSIAAQRIRSGRHAYTETTRNTNDKCNGKKKEIHRVTVLSSLVLCVRWPGLTAPRKQNIKHLNSLSIWRGLEPAMDTKAGTIRRLQHLQSVLSSHPASPLPSSSFNLSATAATAKKAVAVLKGNSQVQGVVTLLQISDGTSLSPSLIVGCFRLDNWA
jgi:hypothetical protein